MMIKIATALVATTMLVSALGMSPSFAQSQQNDCVGQYTTATQAYCGK
jgi:hypothetical protein